MANPPTTITGPPSQDEDAQTDFYEYGWRYVRRDLPDGDYELDRVPLTLQDVLHPQTELRQLRGEGEAKTPEGA